ncbi:MAG: CRISPR-associated helicase Cas3' [Candidatus Firestonebacteria bacterium]
MSKHEIYIAHRREKDGKIQDLLSHLKNVSKQAGIFASKIGLKKQGELIGLLHDLGKVSKKFSDYIKSAVGLIAPDEDDYVDSVGKKGRVDHSSAGAQLIFNKLFNKNACSDDSVNNAAVQALSLCIASHHSGLIDCISPEGKDIFNNRMKKAEEKTHLNEVWGKLDKDFKELIERNLTSKELIEDIVKALKSFFKKNKDSKETYYFKSGLMIRFLYSCLIDADRLDTADFESPALAKLRNNGRYISWDTLIEKLDFKLKLFKNENKIDELRCYVSEQCQKFSKQSKGLYQLTVPTGGGKTLASLRFGLYHAKDHKMDRIIYVLPYTSIIDQNAEEIRIILEDKDKKGKYLNRVVLEHHSNLTPEKESKKQKILSEDWDAPIVITTNVQLLESLFGYGTRNARKMHQLANAVIVFDEVQAIPLKCVHLFNVAINFLVNNCGATVLLCTATQPLLDKVEPVSRSLKIEDNQKIIPNAKKLFNDLKRVEIFDKRKEGGWKNEEIKDLIFESLKTTGSTLVIVNTKTAAYELYQQCLQNKKSEIFHLSTNMCPAHRIDRLAEMRASLDDKKLVLCISTQLIEAGIDIDFGSVIRFLSGLDSIAQAAGRCNRHGRRSELGKVLIINSATENLNKLRDIRIGKEKAERVLDEFKNNPDKFDNDILGPKAMELYYKYYFYERKDEMKYPVNEVSVVGRNDDLFTLLSTNVLSVKEFKRINNQEYPQIFLRQAFMSASKSFCVINAPTRGVVVPYSDEGKKIINDLCSEEDIKKQYKLLKRSQRYSVNVFSNVLGKLIENGAVFQAQKGIDVLCVHKNYYSDIIGLVENPVEQISYQCL